MTLTQFCTVSLKYRNLEILLDWKKDFYLMAYFPSTLGSFSLGEFFIKK